MYWKTSDIENLKQTISPSDANGLNYSNMELLNMGEKSTYYLSPARVLAGGLELSRLEQGESFDIQDCSAVTNVLLAISSNQWAPAYPQDATPVVASMPEVGSQALDFIRGQLNLTIVDKPRTQMDNVTSQQYSSDLLSVGEILGSEDLEVQQDLYDRGRPTCEDDLASFSILSDLRKAGPLVNIFVQNLALTGHFSINRSGYTGAPKNPFSIPKNKKNLSHYDLNNSDNVVDASRHSAINFKEIAPQTTALLLSQTDMVINNWHDMDFDLLIDSNTSEYYRYNYDMIVRIEALTGYEQNKDGTILMMSPKFAPLTNKLLNKVTGDNVYMCRIRKYTNDTLGVGQSNGIDIKFFDEYFLLSEASTWARKSRRRATGPLINNDLGLPSNSVGAQILNILLLYYGKLEEYQADMFYASITVNQRDNGLDIL